MVRLALPLLAGWAAASAAVAEPLPGLTYRYTTFAVSDPLDAAAFLSEYTDGALLNASEFQLGDTGEAVVAGVRLAYSGGGDDDGGGAAVAAYSDVYFLRDESLPFGHGGDTAISPGELDAALARTHTMAQDDWDWWMDWHLAFAVAGDGALDQVAARLQRGGVPFVNRGSLYFTIPRTGITVQVGRSPRVLRRAVLPRLPPRRNISR